MVRLLSLQFAWQAVEFVVLRGQAGVAGSMLAQLALLACRQEGTILNMQPQGLGYIAVLYQAHYVHYMKLLTFSPVISVQVPYILPDLPPKTLLDTNKYAYNEQYCVECRHHIEWASWPRTVEQCASCLSEQQDTEATKQTVCASY